ncbi:hypothetical protein TorRG33x02_126220 [Trema orientale]|uniref:Uncharacterized protein n=1 Tax=Trema orientale TaxID=63057 RepID=A0A2P5F1C2_TREOI|nr:hypothetical protein TorRG33x02_126220 [Trema orientale]
MEVAIVAMMQACQIQVAMEKEKRLSKYTTPATATRNGLLLPRETPVTTTTTDRTNIPRMSAPTITNPTGSQATTTSATREIL